MKSSSCRCGPFPRSPYPRTGSVQQDRCSVIAADPRAWAAGAGCDQASRSIVTEVASLVTTSKPSRRYSSVAGLRASELRLMRGTDSSNLAARAVPTPRPLHFRRDGDGELRGVVVDVAVSRILRLEEPNPGGADRLPAGFGDEADVTGSASEPGCVVSDLRFLQHGT